MLGQPTCDAAGCAGGLYDEVRRDAGCGSLACLEALPAEELFKIGKKLMAQPYVQGRNFEPARGAHRDIAEI